MTKRVLDLKIVSRGPELPALVADSIIREIAGLRLRPGDRLPTEQALATMFGVSRNVVREAMARLRSGGIVWSRQGSGFFVSDAPASVAPPPRSGPPRSSADAFRDLFEARDALEPGIAGLAAERRQEHHLNALDRALSAMSAALYGSHAWLENDIAFHRCLVAATGNELFVQVIEAVTRRLRESLLAARVQPELATSAESTIREHEAILLAVRASDAAAADQAMRKHLFAAQGRLGW